MMNETMHLVIAALAGIVAGLIFFGGLWFTTRRLATMKCPALWLPLGFFVRLVIVLGIFYQVGNGSFPRMAIAFVGFLIGRTAVFQLTRRKEA